MSFEDTDKHYYTIGKASKELDIEQHVLRFWETQFKQIKPIKNNSRRYYTKEDLKIIKQIKELLHNKGYTIKGVQRFLSSKSEESDQTMTDQDKKNKIMDSIKQLRYIQSKLEQTF
jgi:DNA-binding transcriptional MerR regulator